MSFRKANGSALILLGGVILGGGVYKSYEDGVRLKESTTPEFKRLYKIERELSFKLNIDQILDGSFMAQHEKEIKEYQSLIKQEGVRKARDTHQYYSKLKSYEFLIPIVAAIPFLIGTLLLSRKPKKQ